jgi:hypothetical protein
MKLFIYIWVNNSLIPNYIPIPVDSEMLNFSCMHGFLFINGNPQFLLKFS